MKRDKTSSTLISIFVTLALLAITIISACAQPAPTAPTPSPTPAAPSTPIKIGLLLPETGSFAIVGEGVINGFKLGMEQAGYKVAGRTIEVVLLDEGGDPTFAMDNARKMVEADKIALMVGPFNTNVRLPVLPYTSSKKIPNIACVCDTPEAVEFPYVYSPFQTVYSQPVPLGWFAYDELGMREVVTLANDWHAGRDFIDGFAYGFTKDRPGKVIQQQWSPFGTQDYSSYLLAMKKADGIAEILGVSDMVQFLTQGSQAGIFKEMPILEIGATLLDQMLPQLGPLVIDHIWSLPEYESAYDSPVNKKFRADYEAKYGHPADFSGASGYTRAQIVLAALQATNGNTDPDVFHEAIKALKVETPQGTVTFTAGNPNKSGVQGIITPFIETLKLVNGQYVWSVVKQYPPYEPRQKP